MLSEAKHDITGFGCESSLSAWEANRWAIGRSIGGAPINWAPTGMAELGCESSLSACGGHLWAIGRSIGGAGINAPPTDITDLVRENSSSLEIK